mgnify:CR=1 FL=1
MDSKQSFSTSEVAKYCHVTADTIRKWAEAGRISVFKTPGGHRRIRREDLLRFLRENSIPVHGDLHEDGVKVLVVDDEQSIVTLIQRFLDRSKVPFEVRVAMDGFEVGKQMGTFEPNVVFLDIRLPGVDGFEVCRRIKAQEDGEAIHIIAMTGYYEEEVAEKIKNLGAVVCMSKPFTPDDLRKALAKVGVEVA